MIELFENNVKTDERQSSKGNQLKWLNGNDWYKADYSGYEGLAEFAVSKLLAFSNLKKDEYVTYETEEISYKHTKFLGCKSENFLPKGWRLITLERLFQSMYSQSLNKSIYSIEDYKSRIEFLVNQTIRITGLEEFGAYMSRLLTIDAFFLNEDRHTHNIAVLMDEDGKYHYCPVFDNGAALMSDIKMDYPLEAETEKMVDSVSAKTFCRSFDEQLDIVEQLYGQNIQFDFCVKDVYNLIDNEPYYSEIIKERVKYIILQQKRKYEYLFKR